MQAVNPIILMVIDEASEVILQSFVCMFSLIISWWLESCGKLHYQGVQDKCSDVWSYHYFVVGEKMGHLG